MTSNSTFVRKLAAAVALAAAVTACSSQGGAQQEQAGAGTGGSVGGQRYTIAVVTHEPPGDSFWDKIRRGAQDAAAAHNVDLRYSNAQQAPEQATLVQNA